MRPADDPPARGRVRDARAVFLVGFMGAGKTTVGQALSRRLGFRSKTWMIGFSGGKERRSSRFFASPGKQVFAWPKRRRYATCLVSWGLRCEWWHWGAALLSQPGNVALIEEAQAHSVFLNAPVEELFGRCAGEAKERPLRQSAEQFRELYEKRQRFYLKAALRIDTNGKDVETVAAEVACSLGLE